MKQEQLSPSHSQPRYINLQSSIVNNHLNNMIEDQFQFPHFQNSASNPLQSEQKTPQKHQENHLAQGPLSKSSAYQGKNFYSNPYCQFEDEGDDHNVILKLGKQRKKQKNFQQMPQKLERQYPLDQNEFFDENQQSQNPSQQNISLQQQIQIQYEKILKKIQNNQQFELPIPFFFKGKGNKTLTKLLCFQPNSKNGQYIKFNMKTQTCESTYFCYGCKKQFNQPSALGGHLSKCEKKAIHFEKLEKNLPMSSSEEEKDSIKQQEDEVFYSQEQPEEIQIKIEVNPEEKPILMKSSNISSKNFKRTAKKVLKRDQYTSRCGVASANRRMKTESRLIRSAKLKAAYIIKESIKNLF